MTTRRGTPATLRTATSIALTLAFALALSFTLPHQRARAAAPPALTPSTPSRGKRLVIIDQDAFGPAGSNMQAILMLLQASDVEVLGITVTSGDGWRDEEVDQTLRLLEIAGRTEVPVVPGAVVPLINTASRTKAWEHLYGNLFYKGAWTESWPDQGIVRRTPHPNDPTLIPVSDAGSPRIKPAAESAADFLIRQVHAHPGEITVIAAGPLTNLALAARLDPRFSSLARELVFMGGSFNPTAAKNAFAVEYANSPRREFNMRWDPEAASLVLHEPWKKVTQVPIDPTTKTFFSAAMIQRVGESRTPFAAYLGKFGESYPMWDELAVAVWLDPTLVTHHESLAVDIDTSFTASYGDTLSWSPADAPGLGERVIDVVLDVDVQKFEGTAMALLTRSNARP